MVVDQASSSPADSFNDSPPTSDEDPYSSSSSSDASTLQYHIDVRLLPKPIPFLGPILGYNSQLFEKVWADKIKSRHAILGRAPTQDEAAGLAYWTAKQISIISYGTPIGVAGGLWRAWAMKETFQFPFYRPKPETFQSTIFPHSKVPLLGGNRAFLAWHTLRVLAYGGVGKYIGDILLGSYSMSVATVGELSDPRMKDIVNAMRQKAQRKQGGLPSSIPVEQPGSTQRGGAGTEQTQLDDASPTGGLYGNDETSMRQDGGGKSDEPYPRNWSKPGYSQSQIEALETPRALQADDFNNASPTGGQGIRADTAQQSESSWDRIRRGSKSGGQSGSSSWPTDNQGTSAQKGESAWAKLQNNTQQEQPKESSTGDSFTFSKTDEERNLAKIEAQKEFDARVEQERRGGDFSSGGDQKRW